MLELGTDSYPVPGRELMSDERERIDAEQARGEER